MSRSRAVPAFLVLVLTGAAANAQQAPTAQAVVQRAVDAWRPVKTVRATFEQYVANSLTATSAHATGDFQQQRPGKLSVRFRDPSGDQIVTDGAFVWLYLPSTAPGQVVKRPMGRDGAGTMDFTSEFLDAPLTKYEVVDGGPEQLDSRATHIVRLTPKPGVAAQFTAARVWVDDADGFIRQFELREASGVMRRIHLTALTVNTPVDDAVFRFTVPNGVRVVTR